MHPQVFAVLIAVLYSNLVKGETTNEEQETLFETAKSVIDLSSDQLDAFSHDSASCPWIVLFYHSDCGHCRSFAPHYASVADAKSTFGSPFLYAALNCKAHEKVCKGRDVHAFPTVRAFSNGEWVDVKATSEAVRDYFNKYSFSGAKKGRCRALWQFFQERSTHKLKVLNKPGVGKDFKQDDTFHQDDVANAFFSTMWHEVPMRPVDEQSTEALVNFLKQVDETLPQLEASYLLKYLDEKGSPSNIDEWKRTVERAGIPINGRTGDLKWKTCQGSNWKFRGFPCGMWLLFHAMVHGNRLEDTNEVMHSIFEYVKLFFSCAECRSHFTTEALPFDKDDGDGSKAVLWLWRKHNSVNLRLAAEGGMCNDPRVPKIQYPTKQRCPKCYRSQPVGEGEDPFDEAEVFLFLKQRYKWDRTLLRVISREGNGQDTKVIAQGPSTLSMVLAAILLFCIIVFVMWQSLQTKVPAKERPEYLAQRARLLRQVGSRGRSPGNPL